MLAGSVALGRLVVLPGAGVLGGVCKLINTAIFVIADIASQQCEARLSSIVVSTSRCGRDDLSSILRKGIYFCSFVVAAVVVLCFASVSIGPLVVACAPLFCFLS